MEEKYQEALAGFTAERMQKNRISRRMLALKLISFLLLIGFAWFSYSDFSQSDSSDYHYTNLVFALLSAILYVYALVADARLMQRIEVLDAMICSCQREIAYLKGDFMALDDGSRYLDKNHPFTYDLDIFGPDSLYHRINRTVTQGGADVLANKFRILESSPAEIQRNQEVIAELIPQFQWRLRFLSIPKVESHLVGLFQDIHARMMPPSGKTGRLGYYLLFISPLLTFSLFLAFCFHAIPGIYFFLIFMLQLLTTILLGRKIQVSGLATDKLCKEFKGYVEILETIRSASIHAAKFRELRATLFHQKENSALAFRELSRIQNLFDQRSNALMYVLLNGFFLYDLHLNRRFVAWIRRNADYVNFWVHTISEIDALVSLATYSSHTPGVVFPEILSSSDEDILQIKMVSHPFLAHKHPVSNDYTLKRNCINIITGANMAGKSTFLRTIGVNYILATAGGMVCAESFRFRIISLFSSMRAADNLSQDISYFHAELLRLQQLLEYVHAQPYTLVILDEILKGTNSEDKLNGSRMFLKEISKCRMSAIIATHDLQLSHLAEDYPEVYRNSCFEIELSDEIQYTYKMHEGVARNMNASFLLQKILKKFY